MLDLHTLMEAREGWQSLLCDGLHLSGEGQKLLATELLSLIRREMPQLAPVDNGGLPMDSLPNQGFLTLLAAQATSSEGEREAKRLKADS